MLLINVFVLSFKRLRYTTALISYRLSFYFNNRKFYFYVFLFKIEFVVI
jgi:hypothetical protein